MVVYGYTLHLYCDCALCEGRQNVNGSEGAAEYTGETYGECAAQAKAEGWKISRDRGSCTAPGHK